MSSDPTQHVTSLDLSRKLKSAGVPQSALFYWYESPSKGWSVMNYRKWSGLQDHERERFGVVAGYTASELGAMLRYAGLSGITSYEAGNGEITASGQIYHEKRFRSMRKQADTEANARALLLLLIEEGHFHPQEEAHT